MPEHEIDKELKALRADVTKLRADLAGVADALKDAGKERIDEAKASLGSLADALREELRQGFEGARDRGKESVEAAERQIGKRPLVTLLAALGVGVLLGSGLCWTRDSR